VHHSTQFTQEIWNGGKSQMKDTEKFIYRGEYDNYSIPKTTKKETPETRKKLAEALKQIDLLAKEFHEEK